MKDLHAHVRQFSDAETFWHEACHVVCQAQPAEMFRLAASGGSAARIFEALRGHDFHWSNTVLYQVDERFVPSDQPDSNARLLQEKVGDDVAAFHPFPILDTPAASVDAYRPKLTPDHDGFLFDMTILGVGPDGHTASLFPGESALDVNDLVAVTQTDEFAVRDRLTLTFAAIERSRQILVLMAGAGKKDIFHTITNPNTDWHDYPARRVLDWPQSTVFFGDF